MNVAIIGCGLIGQKRAKLLAPCQVVLCVDVVPERAAKLAGEFGARYSGNWRDAIGRQDVQMLLVSATHDVLAEITLAAARAGQHVLVEKPGACRAHEINPILEACQATGALVRVGFNHRYHPALLKAGDIVESGVLGPLMFVRGRYGHGGRLGYENEWRARPELSGGGELIDQGVHLIDLARRFLGDFVSVQGFAHTYFWNMPVEDNGFMLLKTAGQQTAFLHASCSEWKNTFSFEIYGRSGKLEINGLGGSYGVERLTHYRMLPEMGPPETTSWEYPRGDRSWELELCEFLEDIRLGRSPAAGLRDAQKALEVVEEVYRQSNILQEWAPAGVHCRLAG
ncbi:MAG TPA: Gfo/Idh/MocA family oxidoreductase [Planctomycetaceae bacterium]|jgi:predicted dehydrogenase